MRRVRLRQRVLQRSELVRDPRFVSKSARTDDRQALRAIIVEVFLQLSAEQVIELGDTSEQTAALRGANAI